MCYGNQFGWEMLAAAPLKGLLHARHTNNPPQQGVLTPTPVDGSTITPYVSPITTVTSETRALQKRIGFVDLVQDFIQRPPPMIEQQQMPIHKQHRQVLNADR